MSIKYSPQHTNFGLVILYFTNVEAKTLIINSRAHKFYHYCNTKGPGSKIPA